MEKAEIREKIDHILDEAESELSKWELEFLTNIREQMDNEMITLSPRVIQIIEQIEEKKCP